MGKRKKKNRKREEDIFVKEDSDTFKEFEYTVRNQGIKQNSKIGKKMKKKFKRLEEKKRHFKKYDAKMDELDRCGFYMVTASVKGELTFDKKFLLSSIQNYIDEPFCALGNFINTDSLSFYIDGTKDIAEAITILSKKIQSSDGQVITFKLDFVTDTDFILNCDQIELIKNIVLQRFDEASGLLNLSSFHLDNRLIETNTFAPLSNQRIYRQILTFIKDTLPSLNAFDLSNNKLRDSCIESLKILNSHSFNLSAINLENNSLRSLKDLEHLRLFPLKELKILGNEFPECKGSSKLYIKIAKKALPFLKILDGFDLSQVSLNSSKYINLNAASMKQENSSNLNAVSMKQENSSTNNVVSFTEENVRTFLEQYYLLFDTSDKGTLLQAYVPTAKIELNSQNPLFPNKIFEGQSQIQEFLNFWPESKHDHSSFRLEILSLSSTEGICQIEGSCSFVQNETTVLFKRVMKIVPFNAGYCCSADMLCIL